MTLNNHVCEQADQFDHHTQVWNIVWAVEVVTYAGRLSQLAMRIAGVGEEGGVVGKYRSHGLVLPISMMQRDHRIICRIIILFGPQAVQLPGPRLMCFSG